MFWAAVSGLILLAFAYVVGMAAWQSAKYPLYGFQDLLMPYTIDVVIVGWLAWIGSSIGSFLNVVAWRMPRGKSVGGRSHCPRCGTQLLARDNFPVLGWLAVRGRCRACRLPISIRYPIVEASVGMTLTLLGIAELYRFSLPGDVATHVHGPIRSPMIGPTLLSILIYHVVAVSVAWAIGLILYDRQRVPAKLIGFAAVAIALVPLAWPHLLVVTWMQLPAVVSPSPADVGVGPTWRDGATTIDAIIRVITALAAAGLAGRSLARGFCPTADLKLNPLGSGSKRLIDLIVMISVPAIVVGWQALSAVLLIASLAAVAVGGLFNRTDALGRFGLMMPVALTVQLVSWRPADQIRFWPSETSDPWTILVAAAAVLCIPMWLSERPAPVDQETPQPSDVDDGSDDHELPDKEAPPDSPEPSETEPRGVTDDDNEIGIVAPDADLTGR